MIQAVEIEFISIMECLHSEEVFMGGAPIYSLYSSSSKKRRIFTFIHPCRLSQLLPPVPHCRVVTIPEMCNSDPDSNSTGWSCDSFVESGKLPGSLMIGFMIHTTNDQFSLPPKFLVVAFSAWSANDSV